MTVVTQTELDYKSRTTWFVFASLVLHVLVMTLMSHEWSAPKTLSDNKPIDVDIVPLSQKDIDRIKTQIVETALTEKADKAAKDAFLSAQTQVVKAQTRAKETAPFRDGKTGGAQGTQEKKMPATLGKLGVPMNFKPLGNLGPGETASTSDYLKDIKQGAQTMLSTKEFAYYSFYQRVRKQLEQYWEPGLRQRLKGMFERGRQLANDQEHLTRVMVLLDQEGTIKKVQVEGTSGLLDLDQAAVDAFNKAGPFPNPPKGMIERDGTVKVEWEFVLKT